MKCKRGGGGEKLKLCKCVRVSFAVFSKDEIRLAERDYKVTELTRCVFWLE